MPHRTQMTAVAGQSHRAQSHYQFAWARAISTFMALDLKEQTYLSAGMLVSPANGACSLVDPGVTPRKSGNQ
ncbi:MAG: hypothetical protein DRQ63_08890 [Gammaproteobacteria bacterium]|nr:MAG: hypothetical protein DRQ63_08890 [Gammaproteobacteria bacterium]